MHIKHALYIEGKGERELLLKRVFSAPPEMVFDAYTKPELLRRWFTGPDGWALSVCEVDLRVDGAYRFVWSGETGEMAVSGTYRSIERPHVLVTTERFDQQWYPGESLITSSYRSHPQGTELQITILYESSDARDTVLNSKTARGIANSYDRLEALLVGLLSDPGRS